MHVSPRVGGRAHPSIRAESREHRRGERRRRDPVAVLDAGAGIDTALARWADGFAAAASVGPLRPPPTAWCSWYHYFERVTQDDIEENLRAIDDLGLDIDVVQIDDGYQAEIGDWLLLSDRFASLDIVGRIRGAGRRAGIWVAPFLVGERSVLAREHPDWLVGDAAPAPDGPTSASPLSTPRTPGWRPTCARSSAPSEPGHRLLQDRLHLRRRHGRAPGADDVSGVEAYRHGLRVIREAIGPDAYLLGCGAPILPSVGLVDAMRVGPDIAHHYEPMMAISRSPPSAAAQNTRWRGSTGGSG